MPFSAAYTGSSLRSVQILFGYDPKYVFYQAFFDKIGILSVSKSTYYRHLKDLVYPCTYEFWLKDQAKTINEVLVNILL